MVFRVRYSEIDQMGTFYNSRALDWFECGRTELLRSMGTPYVELEAQGVLLPVIEAHVEYLGRAGYDDLLQMTTTAAMCGRASIRFDMSIEHAAGPRVGKPVARGHTIHAFCGRDGKPTRPPAFLVAALEGRPTE
jgi:acyl-CoA thioester hydrolase